MDYFPAIWSIYPGRVFLKCKGMIEGTDVNLKIDRKIYSPMNGAESDLYSFHLPVSQIGIRAKWIYMPGISNVNPVYDPICGVAKKAMYST